MRINNNITAMNTHRQYTINNNAISKSAEKLSSGYRVNRAGDDAAGLAISEKMRAQIRGLSMASKNSQDGNSLIQTAEGALQEVHAILQRMNELAVQAATGTNQTLDRNALNDEFQQLTEEIDDIAKQTNFNDMSIFDGSFNNYETAIPATTIVGYINGAAGGIATLAKQLATSKPLTVGNYSIAAVGTTTGTISDRYTVTAGTQTFTVSLSDIFQGVNFSSDKDEVLLKAGDKFVMDLSQFGMGSYEVTAGTDLTGANFDTIAKTIVTTAVGANAGKTPLKIQIGARQNDLMTVGIGEINSSTLGISAAKLTGGITTQIAAGTAVSQTRVAINEVSKVRSALGAAQNRLDHKISNLENAVENLQAAESRIRDVDMASEMTNFTKNSILSQAATAMLAQANALPQNVLQLLR